MMRLARRRSFGGVTRIVWQPAVSFGNADSALKISLCIPMSNASAISLSRRNVLQPVSPLTPLPRRVMPYSHRADAVFALRICP